MKGLAGPSSIKKSLLTFFIVLFLIPFIGFCLIWYIKSAETIQESEIYYNEQLIRRVNTQLDDFFAGIKADSMPYPGHPLVQEFIKSDPFNTYEMYHLKARLNNELIPNLRKDIYEFSIISAKGAYYGEFHTVSMPEYPESFKILGLAKKNDFPVITVYRKIIDNKTYKTAGAIIMGLSVDQLQRIASIKPYGKSGYIVIANESGEIIYHTEKEKIGTFLPEKWKERMGADNGRFVEDSPEGKKMMLYQVSDRTHFTIISETSKYEMLGGLQRLQLLTLTIGILILILAFVVFYRMLREIQLLLSENHKTRLREKELQIKNREALLSALQARINPHFLYNTLEIINSYAVVFNVEPISKMTVQLSSLFRYSVSNPDQVILLRKELEHIRTYINIQKERFEELRFEVNVEEEMLDRVYLFRLIIQPLVENAFQHAYEKHGKSPGWIQITGLAEKDYYSLYIQDKGKGMAPELKQKYNEAFEWLTEGKMSGFESSPFQQIGLWNVHARLRLAFGHPFGLRICDSGEEGSIFQIKLPYMRGVIRDVQSVDCG
ncbi:cache domain-containing sensor histidine kinase [Paenibacillus spongiae]|uniref:Histidine kinase n=1 Tax=Paenibacillus spongiae TaxID=2909671 RepID=A0ABY5S6V7_9BACL|nr:histidine kinase [Paenibacillus spongiae]UVI29399.1 histidine kinase [Paenibacillus spongiae]